LGLERASEKGLLLKNFKVYAAKDSERRAKIWPRFEDLLFDYSKLRLRLKRGSLV